MNRTISSLRPSGGTKQIAIATSAAVAALAIACVVVAPAFMNKKPSRLITERNADFVIFDLADTSASFRTKLPATTGELPSLCRVLGDEEVYFTMFRFDSKAEEAYSDVMPDSPEDLLADICPKLSVVSDHDNTYLDKVFEAVVPREAAIKGQCVIRLQTDGWCEGMTAEGHRRLKEAAKKLAGSPHLRAVFVEGVDPKNMATMRDDLSPLADRLKFVSAGTLDTLVVRSVLVGEK